MKDASSTLLSGVLTHPSEAAYATIGQQTHKKILQTTRVKQNHYYSLQKSEENPTSNYPNTNPSKRYTRIMWDKSNVALYVKTEKGWPVPKERSPAHHHRMEQKNA